MIERDHKFGTIINSVVLDDAKNYAYRLHDFEVNQKYGDNDALPYSFHLKNVVSCAEKSVHLIADSIDDVVPIIFAAAFHDSIEDARLTYNDVMKIAEDYMLHEQAYMATEIVYALTNEKGRNRAERANDKYYEGIKATKYAPFVKMCDRVANMNYSCTMAMKGSMAKKYREELDHFIESIYVDNAIPQELIDYAKTL